ncbi:DgyrCDS5337 [Dimorphilus gyrociliatus]|uniref:DgyrCDS5337 n=1 Tax=Dimorphilus gyrociliatus TaxID=2664684 RepID=A0A7I8VL88_9ANNE|nr:DgyrCDS5337 [Dimorphilus gyrociliatus]
MLKDEKLFPEEFEGFNKRKLRVATLHYPPFVKRQLDSNGNILSYTGMCIEMLDALANRLNFTYDLMEPADKTFGIEVNESGEWNGLIGLLQRREVDLVAGALTITHTREDVVDFTHPYWEEPTVLVIREPTRTVDMFAFFKQGAVSEIKSSSGRYIVGTWWIFVLVIVATYTGNLIAFLTTNIPKLPFSTLEQMAQQKEYAYGLQDGIVQMMLFKTSSNPTYKRVWEGISSHRDDVLVKDTTEGLVKAKNEKYIYIGEKTNIEAEMASDCNITLLPEEFFKVGFGFALQDGDPYGEVFNKEIMSILEGGLIQRWKKKHWPAEHCKATVKIAHVNVISFRDCIGQFALLAAGIGVATLILTAEYLILHTQKRRFLKKKKRRISVASVSRRVGSVPPFKIPQADRLEDETPTMNKLSVNESDSAVYSVSSTPNSSCENIDVITDEANVNNSRKPSDTLNGR